MTSRVQSRRSAVSQSLVLLLATGATFVVAGPSEAIPAFSRQTRLDCYSCHTLPPELNRFGREFLANGYRLPGVAPDTPPPPQERGQVFLPVSMRLRATAIRAQPENTLDFDVPTLSVEVGLPLSRRASFWTDYFLKTGDEGARPGDIVLGINGLLSDRLDLRVGQLSPPLLMDSQRRLLVDLPDVYARGTLVNGWFLARRRLGAALLPRMKTIQPGLYLFGEDLDSDLQEGRPDWAGSLEWPVNPSLTLQLYGYLGDVIVAPEGQAGFRDKFRQGTISVEYLQGRWHLFGAYSTGRHDNADGLGTRSTNEGAYLETHWQPRKNVAGIVRVDYGDNPLLAPRRLTSVTFGFTRRDLDDHVRYLLEYRLREGRDNDRVALELEVNF